MAITQLTFKTPDVIDYALENINNGIERNKIRKACKKWVQYNEYITIEIDTEKDTATVLEVKD